MKISFISTVFNEEENIVSFIESILSQTKKPDEIVIVDGGSSDGTVTELKNQKSILRQSSGQKLKIIIKRGNRSVGRNEGIRRATGEIIAVSDAGCFLDKDWLKNITQSFKDDSTVDVVAGYYQPLTHSIFEKCLATYTCVMPDRVRPCQFLPSSRSVAFKKLAWEKVGGYPEHLDTCEDLVFAQKFKRAGFKFTFNEKAFVFWPQRKNLYQAFGQFFRYAVGDGQTLFTPYSVHRGKIIFLFARFLFALSLIIYFIFNPSILLFTGYCLLFATYAAWAILKNYRYVCNWQAIFFLPLLQLTADVAVLLGTTAGFVRSLFL